MTFLDSSAIIDMLEGIDETVEFVQSQDDPLLTSGICVYEVLDGALGSGTTDVATERQRFGGVRAIELTDTLAVEAGQLQDKLMSDGVGLSARDCLIAATARSVGDQLVVADSDFQTRVLESEIDVTNLRG